MPIAFAVLRLITRVKLLACSTRELGFEVAAVRELLTLGEQPDRPNVEVDGIARRHVEDIDRRITQLVALRRELQHSLDACGHGQVGEGRVIEALAEQPTVQAVQKS
jgi:DNA-binding transcriptional MerR regulator